MVTSLYFCQITCVFSLYIWCAAADPADPGVFRSKKYLKIPEKQKDFRPKDSKIGGESTSSIQEANSATTGGKSLEATVEHLTIKTEKKDASSQSSSCCMLVLFPCALVCSCLSPHDESSDQQLSEDGMFYCNLCEVEVLGWRHLTEPTGVWRHYILGHVTMYSAFDAVLPPTSSLFSRTFDSPQKFTST